MKKLSLVVLTILIICISASDGYSAQYWAKTFSGTNDEFNVRIRQTTDGGYVLAGGTESFGGVNRINHSGKYNGNNSPVKKRQIQSIITFPDSIL